MRLEPGAVDPRVRRFVMPSRIVWRSACGLTAPEALLADDDSCCIVGPAPAEGEAPAILLDFGRELHGGIRIETPMTSSGRPARFRVRFGESVSEAMGQPSNDHTIHDDEMLVPWFGYQEVGNTGFRFVRIDRLDADGAVDLRRVRAVFIYRDLPYLGSFQCSDQRLNRIWDVGAYTVHLNMQDHLWDGIKRDRLVWLGDMHPETMVATTVFGCVDVIPSSFDYVRDRTPLPGWMNGISSYSLWWIICQRDWFLYHGDRKYLGEQREYLTALLKHLAAYVGPDGRETLDGFRFIEWPTSEDPLAIDQGLQSLITMALRAGAWLCDVIGEAGAAVQARELADRTAQAVRPESPKKPSNALVALAGMGDAVDINRRILAVEPDRGVSTFFGYYVLQARALAGDVQGGLDLIRSYWGAMLDLGATTFWEDFNLDWVDGSAGIDELVPEGRRDIHADFGNYCYKGLRHSLCHGWAAGPTAWLSQHVLGITPVEPGYAAVRIRPVLGDLEWAGGAMPTPHGMVTVEHQRTASGIGSIVSLPPGIRQVE